MIGNAWDEILKEEFEKDYFKSLIKFVEEEYKNKTIFHSISFNVAVSKPLTMPITSFINFTSEGNTGSWRICIFILFAKARL